MMVTIFYLANLVVLLFCMWIAVTNVFVTGWWGTLGFSIIGLSSAVNLFKPLRMPSAIDMPETLMLVGLAIVCVWIAARVAYWRKKGGHRGAY
ncbi:holin [Burkholderia vietnamiensis]|uniref:holin n=1 Tax=Burkholderia vietnamiensis TaxID=60552 RepID=UPI001B9F271D|nr:holin [Burkholderia vietnamiensis]MBR8083068.1 holin [Burkholderia vietnamiensis]